MTREGYLFEWQTQAPACQTAVADASATTSRAAATTTTTARRRTRRRTSTLTSLGGGNYRLTFTAPGDDGPCGTPASYIAARRTAKRDLGLGAPAAGGTAVSREVTLAAGARRLSIQAVDEAGNLGPAASVKAK